MCSGYDVFKWADNPDEDEIKEYEEGWKEYYRSKENDKNRD